MHIKIDSTPNLFSSFQPHLENTTDVPWSLSLMWYGPHLTCSGFYLLYILHSQALSLLRIHCFHVLSGQYTLHAWSSHTWLPLAIHIIVQISKAKSKVTSHSSTSVFVAMASFIDLHQGTWHYFIVTQSNSEIAFYFS